MSHDGPRGSRLADWRRLRARRLVAALLVGASIVAGLSAWRPAAATTPVVVAARELPAGHRLTSADVEVIDWPAGAAPRERLSRGDLVGERLLGPVGAGEPVTSGRLLTGRSIRTPGAGDRVVAVTLADPGLAQVLRSGDRVDVLDAEGAAAARSADLLAVVSPETESEWKSAGVSVLLAVSPAEAAALARATAAGPTGRSALTLAWAGRTSET